MPPRGVDLRDDERHADDHLDGYDAAGAGDGSGGTGSSRKTVPAASRGRPRRFAHLTRRRTLTSELQCGERGLHLLGGGGTRLFAPGGRSHACMRCRQCGRRRGGRAVRAGFSGSTLPDESSLRYCSMTQATSSIIATPAPRHLKCRRRHPWAPAAPQAEQPEEGQERAIERMLRTPIPSSMSVAVEVGVAAEHHQHQLQSEDAAADDRADRVGRGDGPVLEDVHGGLRTGDRAAGEERTRGRPIFTAAGAAVGVPGPGPGLGRVMGHPDRTRLPGPCRPAP